MRIQINLNEEILEKVDQEAKRLGTSRGAMLTTWIGEKINNLDMTKTLMTSMFDSPLFKEMMSKELSKKED